MWQTIIEAKTADELESITPLYSEIPAGTPIKIRLELQWWAPIGKLADMAGAEFWAPRLAQVDVDVIDVYGDWHWIEISGRVRGTPVILIVAIIAAAVAILGLGVYISSVVITADIEREKLELADRMLREGYTPEQVTEVLEGVRPTTPQLPAGLPAVAGIGLGAIIAVGAVVFLVMRK